MQTIPGEAVNMEMIEEGDFFEINSPNQKEAVKYVLKKLRKGQKRRANLVVGLQEKEIYKQKKDAQDFIKNLTRSSNFEVTNVGRFNVSLTSKTEEKVLS